MSVKGQKGVAGREALDHPPLKLSALQNFNARKLIICCYKAVWVFHRVLAGSTDFDILIRGPGKLFLYVNSGKKKARPLVGEGELLYLATL